MESQPFFWTRVRVGRASECWPCKNKPGPNGYCFVSIKNRTRLAHRVASELAHGPIPPGVVIRHRCDNRPCCNPAHLLRGTHAENSRDVVERGRHGRRGGSLRGAENARAILTEAAVLEIRDRSIPRQALAEKYGVGIGAIKAVREGRNWSHV